MSHFAQVQKGIVTQVIVAEQDVIDPGLFGSGWVKTSYNTRAGQHPDGLPLRKNYAGIGDTYDSVRDAFIPQKPFDDWVLDEQTCSWVEPQDGQTNSTKVWDEIIFSWVSPENLTLAPVLEQVVEPVIVLSSNEADSIIGADSVNGAM